jgi:AraC-like DNA-binding protein
MIFEEYTSSNFINTDLNVTCYGHQICDNTHYWGPGIRDYYLIHYVVKGSGLFKLGDNSYNLTQGDVFLIEPGVLAYYEADKDDPWEYVWIGFNGTKAEYYISQIYTKDIPPIFTCNGKNDLEICIKEMLSYSYEQNGRDIILQSSLYKFIYLLINNIKNSTKIPEEDVTKKYVEDATYFIANNYSDDISITNVAKYVNITRGYLYRLFKKYLDSSPQKFLINFRMGKACELLRNSNLYIGDIARSVGYRDVLLFSKIFKKVNGITPTEFRVKYQASI